MGKRSSYLIRLMPLLTGEIPDAGLEELLVSESNLPGPRANLELAWGFADCFEKIVLSEELFALLKKWVGIGADQAPTQHPREFLPFCAIQALGSAYFKAEASKKPEIVDMLKQCAGDSRWRIREAVSMGFQRMAEQDFDAAQRVFSVWIKSSSLVEKRAILAALAHSPLLTDPERVTFCLQITQEVLSEVQTLPKDQRKTEGFRILKQGLEYTISLFVERLPEVGFAYLKRWAEQDDPDIKRIVRSNLNKARLAKKYGSMVHSVLDNL